MLMFVAASGLIGLFIGSFLNVLIDRLPKGKQIAKGRSYCDSCKHKLNWYDLVPIISYLLLHGRCRYCKSSIPVRNLIVELTTGVLFGAGYIYWVRNIVIFLNPPINYSFTFAVTVLLLIFIIISCLIAIFFIDLEHRIIPDVLTGIAVAASSILIILNPLSLSIPNYILSAIGSSLFFALLVLITHGRGMGIGDVKFAFFMGLFLGFPGIVTALYIAFLTGAFASVILLIKGKAKFGHKIAFGPFLVVGTLAAFFNIITLPFLEYIL